jgi:hypothetical protein
VSSEDIANPEAAAIAIVVERPQLIFRLVGNKWEYSYNELVYPLLKLQEDVLITPCEERWQGNTRRMVANVFKKIRNARLYPLKADTGVLCNVCGTAAFWTSFCYLGGRTIYRLISLCESCTFKGKPIHIGGIVCRICHKKSPDLLLASNGNFHLYAHNECLPKIYDLKPYPQQKWVEFNHKVNIKGNQ